MTYAKICCFCCPLRLGITIISIIDMICYFSYGINGLVEGFQRDEVREQEIREFSQELRPYKSEIYPITGICIALLSAFAFLGALILLLAGILQNTTYAKVSIGFIVARTIAQYFLAIPLANSDDYKNTTESLGIFLGVACTLNLLTSIYWCYVILCYIDYKSHPDPTNAGRIITQPGMQPGHGPQPGYQAAGVYSYGGQTPVMGQDYGQQSYNASYQPQAQPPQQNYYGQQPPQAQVGTFPSGQPIPQTY